MAGDLDDLEALKTIVSALSPFERPDQERILRWTREKLGLVEAPAAPRPPATPVVPNPPSPPPGGSGKDIKTFIAEKKPASDNQFAAAVAYYYAFEAPEAERRDSITSGDLQEATRLTGRARLNRPADTIQNAVKGGLLDKAAGRGAYSINTVGENLVAISLPQAGGEQGVVRRSSRRGRPRKTGAKRRGAKRGRKAARKKAK